MTPIERYLADLERADFIHDPAQQAAIEHLQRLYDELLSAPSTSASEMRGWRRLLARKRTDQPVEGVRGLYFWGGVGRGKTYLVDTFFDCLPFERKQRIHFHRFMQKVHHELKLLKDQRDPLKIVAKHFAERARILCFDEFFVSDITDAMLLARLLQGLFDRGVTMVATSNIPPDRLYWDGLQRARFLPAIELIKRRMRVVEMDGGTDYRLRNLEQAKLYHCPLGEQADGLLLETFEQLAPETGRNTANLDIEGREITTRRHADGVVWIDFKTLCAGPRGTADYIEIARCFHTVFISDVPVMTSDTEDEARRFLNLVDEFYDRNVKLIMSGAAPLDDLYAGKRLSFEYQRALSRLKEMQSHEYLARQHLP